MVNIDPCAKNLLGIMLGFSLVMIQYEYIDMLIMSSVVVYTVSQLGEVLNTLYICLYSPELAGRVPHFIPRKYHGFTICSLQKVGWIRFLGKISKRFGSRPTNNLGSLPSLFIGAIFEIFFILTFHRPNIPLFPLFWHPFSINVKICLGINSVEF